MKPIVIVAMMSGGLGLFAATPSVKPQTNDTAVAQKRVMSKEMFLRRTGGHVVKPAKGRVAVVNAQRTVDADAVRKSFDYISAVTCIPFAYGEGPEMETKGNVAAFTVPADAAAAVYVVDDAALPMSLVAAESHWGVLNVRPILADEPSEIVMATRLRREMTRVAALVTGGGRMNQYRNSLFLAVRKGADLDDIETDRLPNEAVVGIVENMKKIGVTPYLKTVYLRACKEGWAPQPTNEYQKAIWDRVHEPPSKPIKISYDKDRQKPVVK